jgi:ADP-ribosyl-[dinitrogen reductase] hydrolase
LFASLLVRALQGTEKEQLLTDISGETTLAPAIAAIAAGSHKSKAEAAISGSRYVVESLEAALWCFYSTDNFADAVLTAVNLGDDADTTAAICGQIAGAHYGVAAIPAHWRQQLSKLDDMLLMADQLHAAAISGRN